MTTSVYSSNSNRMLASVDPLGNRMSCTFDLAGQQTNRQDARGNRITYSYDLAGRQIALRNELNLATTTGSPRAPVAPAPPHPSKLMRWREQL
jgi:YD repeat-containing protein